MVPNDLLIECLFVISRFGLTHLVLHCHTLFDNKGKAKICSFKIFQILLRQKPAYFVRKKLTSPSTKRRPDAPQRKDELLHVNGITYIEADLKLNHLRILMAIISELQRAIRLRLTRGNERKGVPEVFLPPKNDRGYRVLTIPAQAFHIGEKNGARLRACLRELEHTAIRFPDSEQKNHFTGFIEGFRFPAYGHDVEIFLQEQMVARLLLVEEGYTAYSCQAALSMANKYTVRLYWLVCSWRNRGGFVLSIDELRRMLTLGPSYDRSDNIVTHILKPSAADLREHYPIWFDFRLLLRSDRQYICFKIGYQVDEETRNKATQEAWDACRLLMNAAGWHAQAIADIWKQLDFEDLHSFTDKLASLTADIRIRRGISNVDAYVHAAMLAWYSDWLLRYSDI